MVERLESKILPSELSSLEKRIRINEEKLGKAPECISTQNMSVPGEHPNVSSSVYGKIKTIVLFFPTNGGHSIYAYFEFIQEFIELFSTGGRRFLLVLESESLLSIDNHEVLKYKALKNKNEFYKIVIDYDANDLAPWAQDSFLSISYDTLQGREQYLVEPSNRFRNRGVAKLLIDRAKEIDLKLNIKHLNCPLPFVGGNLLVSKEFILIGLNQTDERDLKNYGGLWIGKNIILLEAQSTYLQDYWIECKETIDGYCNRYDADTEEQAIFHLDVFITLAGKNKKGEEVILVGQPVIGFNMTADLSEDIKELIKEIIIEVSKAIDNVILTLRKELRELGISFKIVRNPLPLTYYDQIKSEKKIRYWCWATYNNCLVEHYYDNISFDERLVKHTIMPSYGINSDYSEKNNEYGCWTDLHRYDLQNKWIWEELLGFQVTLMQQDYNPFTRRLGSLNCLTNCIERY